MLAWLKKIAPAPLGRPKKKAETRGRPSKAAQQAAQQEEDEPLRHSPPPEQQQPEQQQQTATAKVKKTRINWSLPENQEKLQKAIDEWEAQEETESQPGSFLTRAPPRAPSCTHLLHSLTHSAGGRHVRGWNEIRAVREGRRHRQEGDGAPNERECRHGRQRRPETKVE